jgi:hypothetical protein
MSNFKSRERFFAKEAAYWETRFRKAEEAWQALKSHTKSTAAGGWTLEYRELANLVHTVGREVFFVDEPHEEPKVEPRPRGLYTGGGRCRKCGGSTTYTRQNSHGFCMQCEHEKCAACGQGAIWCSVYTSCPLNKGKNHDVR